MPEIFTTHEAAARLGVTVRRVQALIAAGRLPAEKRGRDWQIRQDDLDRLEKLKPGRKPKAPA